MGGALLLTLLLLPAASAHAVLSSADPAPNSQSDPGLTLMELRFTEDVEREFTNADVLDTINGSSWAAGPVEFDAKAHNVIRLPLKPLPDGLYEATWKALSADTHTTRGAFIFCVGNVTCDGRFQAQVVPQQDAAVFRDGFARFSFFTGLFFTLGIPLFAFFVLRETMPPRRLFATAASFGLVGVAGAGVMLLFLGQRTELGLGALSTAPGRSILWRGILLALATLASAAAALLPRMWRGLAFAAIVAAVGSLLSTATGSHAAAVRENTHLYIAVDALHLLMAAVWIGGVVGFLHVVWGRTPREIAAMILRFSPLAVTSVVVLVATGSVASIAHMPCFKVSASACVSALGSERYMQLVAVKLALMAPLIAIGAYNRYRVAPRLEEAPAPRPYFQRVIQLEAAIMAIVLLAAGVLAASAPPETRPESAEYLSPYLELQNLTKDSHIVLQVSPNPVTVGVQKLVVLVHPLGEPLKNSTKVQLQIYEAGTRPGEVNVELENTAPGEWERTDGFFTHAGDWRVNVLLQRDSLTRVTFNVTVVLPGGTTPSS